MAFNALDMCILVILVISGLVGYKRGFINAVAGIISTVAGLVIACVYRNPAADFLEEHLGVVSTLTNILEKRLLTSTGLADQSGLFSSLSFVKEGMVYLHQQITEIAFLLVAAVCFLLLYTISSQFLKLMAILLEKALPRLILGHMNRAGGLVLILAQNIIIMAFLSGVLFTPLEMSAQIGFKGAPQTLNLMNSSALITYLLQIFTILQTVVGWGV